MRSYSDRWLALAAFVFAAGVTGCGGGGESPEVRRGSVDRIRAVLSAATDSGTVVGLVAGDTIGVSQPTVEFYRRNRYRPVWTDGGRLTEQGAAVHAAVAGAGADGLDPMRYGHGVAAQLIAAVEAKDGLDDAALAGYLADLDVVLSEGFMRYATDLARGTVDPDASGESWRIPRSDEPTEAVLRSAVRGDVAQIVQQMRPNTPYYGRMMQALERLRTVQETGGWEPLPEGTKVEEGDSAEVVVALRARLARSEDPREAAMAQRGTDRPWIYDRDLRAALRNFQARHALDDDGHLGAGTLRELNHTVDERIEEVALNLDRWRWLPNDLGEFFVLVNIAGFELEVVENHRVIESMNVVVGQAGWHTPVFADTMEHVVVNPYWNPPESIMEEEIRPAMARDPGYLARNNFETTSDGRVRQRPGPGNALGFYKFLFPNKDNIYLHDTPADHLFARSRRDFSHGCIRLERPADLARLIVTKTTSHSAEDIDDMRATGSEKWITLKQQVPVYIVYFTVWAKSDGTLQFYHDVYGHDEELRDADAVEEIAAR